MNIIGVNIEENEVTIVDNAETMFIFPDPTRSYVEVITLENIEDSIKNTRRLLNKLEKLKDFYINKSAEKEAEEKEIYRKLKLKYEG